MSESWDTSDLSWCASCIVSIRWSSAFLCRSDELKFLSCMPFTETTATLIKQQWKCISHKYSKRIILLEAFKVFFRGFKDYRFAAQRSWDLSKGTAVGSPDGSSAHNSVTVLLTSLLEVEAEPCLARHVRYAVSVRFRFFLFPCGVWRLFLSHQLQFVHLWGAQWSGLPVTQTWSLPCSAVSNT